MELTPKFKVGDRVICGVISPDPNSRFEVTEATILYTLRDCETGKFHLAVNGNDMNDAPKDRRVIIIQNGRSYGPGFSLPQDQERLDKRIAYLIAGGFDFRVEQTL